MKPRIVLFIAALIALVVYCGSCRKDESPLLRSGCGDPNSPIYQSGIDYDDASCLYGYITEYQISYHPEFDNASGSGDDWDFLVDTDADLVLRIKQDTAAGGWFFESFEQSNQPHNDTAKWGAPIEFQLLNTVYTWELWDKDAVGGDDLVCSGNFNAIENAANGIVTHKAFNSAGDSAELRILYDLRRSY